MRNNTLLFICNNQQQLHNLLENWTVLTPEIYIRWKYYYSPTENNLWMWWQPSLHYTSTGQDQQSTENGCCVIRQYAFATKHNCIRSTDSILSNILSWNLGKSPSLGKWTTSDCQIYTRYYNLLSNRCNYNMWHHCCLCESLLTSTIKNSLP